MIRGSVLVLVVVLGIAGSAAAHRAAIRLTPVSIAFWDSRQGLLAAIDQARCIRPPYVCPTVISATANGGRTWQRR